MPYISVMSRPSHSFLGAFAEVRKAATGFLMSVHMKQLGSHWTFFHEILYLRISRQISRKSKHHSCLTNITCTLHEDLCTFMIIKLSRRILLRMKNVSEKVVEKKHALYSMDFLTKIVTFMR
jgi:hypothetical protein